MEHLMFHWEDIVEVFLDELIQEEVTERNCIEDKLMNHDKVEYQEMPME
jgi:hypothetical protein